MENGAVFLETPKGCFTYPVPRGHCKDPYLALSTGLLFTSNKTGSQGVVPEPAAPGNQLQENLILWDRPASDTAGSPGGI